MTWMKVDDRLHSHRKTRAVLKNDIGKVRDAAPFGLWVLAGSWSSQNGTYGWVPEDELERFDSHWQHYADRLVKAGYWWPQERDGERGFGFVDWADYNPSPEAASHSGGYGNHVRWHAQRGVVEPTCEHCPQEPQSADSPPDDDGESGGDVGSRSGGDIGANRSTQPHPDPNPTQSPSSSDTSDYTDDGFDEWWDVYGHKVDRKTAEAKWKLALKKPGVTADLLIRAAGEYVAHERAENEGGKFIMGPAKWLLRERWTDERAGRPARPQRPLRSVHDIEAPPDGMTFEESQEWLASQAARRAQ